jgi:hypothetical protein
MECTTCHQDRNLELSRVPGAPDWRLAPTEMSWVGKLPAQLCEQLKDPARNGKRELSAVLEHSQHDPLVAWGWHPGFERETPPGTQEQFAALVQAWVAAGAACPPAADHALTASAGGAP